MRFLKYIFINSLLISLLMGCSLNAQTPTVGKNAVTEQIPRNAMTTISGDHTAVQTSISYSDGFSRNTQVIQYRGVPDASKDLVVSSMEYDILGRQSKIILPTPATGATGGFLTTPQANAVTFYGDDAPFSNVDTYEASPLNRALKSYGAGKAWRDNSKFSEMQYEKVGAEIYLFTLNGTTITKSNYLANSLYKEIGISERGNRSITYKDKLGRVVQKSVQDGVDVNNNPTYINTSYLFDQFDRLSVVISPELYKWFTTHSTLTTTQNEFKEGAYFYEYDRRGRLIHKQVPGAGISRYVYDKFDRVVLENDDRDANIPSPEVNYYIFKKYDQLGRIIMTGLINNIGGFSQSDLQKDFDDYTGLPYETRTASGGLLGYTNTSFPSSYTPAEISVKSVMYYDNYDWNTNVLFNFQPASAFHAQEDAKGMMTGSLFRNLETNIWYKSVNYYDFKKRVIEQFSENHLGGIDRMDYQYRFNGEVLKMRITHQKTGAKDLVELYQYAYDHAGRKTSFTHDATVVARYEYDGIGRLSSKRNRPAGTTQGSLQTGNWNATTTWQSGVLPLANDNVTINSGNTVTIPSGDIASAGTLNDNGTLLNFGTLNMGTSPTADLYVQRFSYHIRGGIRGQNLDNAGNLTNELFSFKLGYEDANYFDGNIGKQEWRTGLDNITRSFTYSYDESSRITGGLYAGNGTENYSLNSVSYDKNGNIMVLSRSGLKSDDSFNVVDNLAYTYLPNSNKIQEVTDNSGETASFADAAGSTDYSYWEDGSLKSDANKGISLIEYNYLKLPKRIVKGNISILYQYDASGKKLKETISTNVTDYAGNKIYKNGILYQLGHDEGRIIDGEYEYHIKDHLGNLRVAFRDSLGIAKISQAESYGIWGENLPTLSYLKQSWKKDEFKFTGKENLPETGYTDFGARFYDNLVPRFISIDPLAEKRMWISPYNYVQNNPILRIDPNGESDVYLVGEEAQAAFKQLQSSTSLTLSRDGKTGKVTATGETKTDADKTLLAATRDANVNVVVEAVASNPDIGVFEGNEINNGKVNTFQTVTPSNTSQVDEFSNRSKGVTILHEVLESYIGGANTLKSGSPAKSNLDVDSETNKAYLDAHKQAEGVDTRHKDSYYSIQKPDGYYLKSLTDEKKSQLYYKSTSNKKKN
jgi:RHS repeat-associated protein